MWLESIKAKFSSKTKSTSYVLKMSNDQVYTEPRVVYNIQLASIVKLPSQIAVFFKAGSRQ